MNYITVVLTYLSMVWLSTRFCRKALPCLVIRSSRRPGRAFLMALTIKLLRLPVNHWGGGLEVHDAIGNVSTAVQRNRV